ncbi:MAG: PIG-L family deacetylase [bacterium]|nr:PIG-L family deacetylase [bacterium]
MKNITVGVFAHPDDEAFGPGATLYKLAQSGAEVHLILITDGEAGNNAGYEDLSTTRLAEWSESCRLIGVKSKEALHYPDGGLCNALYVEICNKIEAYILGLLQAQEEQAQLDMITFDHGGITGHLDHIAVSFMAAHIYEKLKKEPPKNTHLGKLKYFCLPKDLQPEASNEWVFMPCGCEEDQIDETIDYSDIIDTKMSIMRAHKSQESDLEYLLKTYFKDNKPACYKDYFAYHK